MSNDYIEKARKAGMGLYLTIRDSDGNVNKIKGLSFKLLNCLKIQDTHTFMDILIRQYAGIGKVIPPFVTEMIKDKDVLMDCGYAFIAGLQGISKENDSGETGRGKENDK